MSVHESFKELLSQQKELTEKYDNLVNQIAQDNLIKENYQLKENLNDLEQTTVELEEKYKILEEKNTNLKTSLHNQFLSERTKIVDSSKKNALIYFGKAVAPYKNKLHELEARFNKNINVLTNIINNKIDSEKEKYLFEIEDIKSRIKISVEQIENDINKKESNFDDYLSHEYNSLENKKLSEEVIKKKENSNNIELKIGLNVINKIAIFVLIIGVITAVQYTYVTWFNDYAKGISVYLLGVILLIFGEWFYKKDKKVFSLGLIGGGIGILYIATFVSYFVLSIIGVYISLILSVGITLIAIILSQKYKSKTICAFSLIGGYAPLLAYHFLFGLQGQAAYVSIVYLLLLNVVVLLLSFRNRWLFIKILSFALNLPAMILLVNNLDNDTISIIYVLVVFITYIAITLINPLLNKRSINIWEIFFLAINTFVKSIFLYNLFPKDYRGLVALIFALIYIALAQLVKRKTKNEKKTQALFYITALTFTLLMIPFQFGMVWTSLGWLIESVLLIYLGKKLVDKNIALAGWIVLGLSFLVFVFNDLLIELARFVGNIYHENAFGYSIFNIKYIANTIGLVLALFIYLPDLKGNIIFRKSKEGGFLTVYKYFTLSHVWIFLMYTIWYIYNKTLLNEVIVDLLNKNMLIFYRTTSYGLITLLYGFILSRMKLLRDSGIKIFVSILYIIGFLYGLGANSNMLAHNNVYTYHEIIGLAILFMFNALVYFGIYEILKNLLEARKLKFQYIPLLLGIYSLGISVSFITKQLSFGHINLVVSIYTVFVSLLYIVIGFNKRHIYLRRFGLGLAIVALAKLFVFDLSHLDLIGKIIAYFSYGVILLGISFVYQKIKNLIDNDV